jgi:hypothetical protein
MNRYRALLLATVLLPPYAVAEIPCPPMPGSTTDVNHDVKSHVDAAVGTLGKVKAGELSVQTEVVAKNLIKDLPHADRLMIAQMMAATYCAMIRDNTAIAEKDKPAMWDRFLNKTYSFFSGNEQSNPDEKKGAPPGSQAPQSRTKSSRQITPAPSAQPAASAAQAPTISPQPAPKADGVPPAPSSENEPIRWIDGQFFVVTGGGANALVNAVLLQGESTVSVSMKDAYAVSGLTGHKQEFVMNLDGYPAVDKVDIPPHAPVWVDLNFNPPLRVDDLLKQWGRFSVTMHYNGITYRREYDEAFIRQKLKWFNNAGELAPHVTLKP